MVPADKRELMEKHLMNSSSPVLPNTPNFLTNTQDEQRSRGDFNDSGFGEQPISEAEYKQILEAKDRRIQELTDEKTEISTFYMNEIDSLTTQLNSALRGMCSSGDIGSEGTLMILEQKLKGYILVKEEDFVIYTEWLRSRNFEKGIESIEHEAMEGEKAIIEAYGTF